jgi:hypothetical protein
MMKEPGVPRFLIFIAAAALSSGCASLAPQTTVRQHPDFASGARALDSLTVLPAEVQFTRIAFSGRARDPDAEATLRRELAESVSSMLEARGFAANTDTLERLDGGDQQLDSDYEQLRAAYAQASGELYRHRTLPVDEASKFEAGVGPIANRLAGAGGANALVLVRYSGYGKSLGQVAAETAAPIILGAVVAAIGHGKRGQVEVRAQVPPSTGGSIEIAVIEGASGKVLWANVFAGDVPPGALAQHALSAFPRGSERKAAPVWIEQADDRPGEANPAATPAPQAK